VPKPATLLILFALALGLIGATVAVSGAAEAWRAVRQAGPVAFASAVLVVLVQFALQTAAWKALNAASGLRVPGRTLFAANVAGMAVNIVTPCAYLGGEPVKVLYAGRRAGALLPRLAGTAVLSKYLEAVGFAVVFGLAVAIAAAVPGLQHAGGGGAGSWAWFMGPAVALAALGTLLLLSLARGWRPLERVVRTLRVLRPRSRRLARLLRRTRDMEREIGRIYREAPRATAWAFILLLSTHVSIFLRPAVFYGLGSGLRLTLPDLCLVYAAGQGMLALQFAPSGAGVLDGGMLGVYAARGLPAGEAMALLLALRLCDLLVLAAGALLAAGAGIGAFRRTPEAHPQAVAARSPSSGLPGLSESCP
jgi:uncharacterized membrane protein YbhN (UPF0104 family)